MNINPYAAEQLMRQKQSQLDKKLRNAWVLAKTKAHTPSLFDRLAAKFSHKTISKRNTINQECCCATC
ncbi:hypothetical protein SD71_21420 [Cohnella kolymensis]|uniref:Uncharacterized protein n=1 Tax=Cohnella kolymensis TaxID=1590652 RepID=A0ABR4ZZG9_9BACL|nr:hypothetical protein [Cohnella kolymensis]KIL34217.1 hypothetical protein SD71_21420 [Cohnella kolymensis]